MTNQDVAHLLRQFADLMDIKGENAFRVSAFRRASDLIAKLDQPIADLVVENRATELPGIGTGIAADLAEMIESGSFGALNDLLDQIPGTLLTMLDIPGVGPKTVGRLYRELSITNLRELEVAASAGEIQTLKGMGKRQEARILEGIAFLNQRTGRVSIGAALPEAREIVRRIHESLGVRVELAGSVRRMLETVGNIDLIVEDADPEQVATSLERDLNVTELERTGEIVHGRTASGVNIRVITSPRDRFGSEWVRLTGSAGHVEALRSIADGDLPDASEEASVYSARGLPWIPPEIREETGEIEAARSGTLPDLLNLDDVRGDLHLHTDWSDGRSTILEMALSAMELGYQYLAIADHSAGLGIARGLDRDRLEQQRFAIDEANQHVPEIRLLSANEVEVHRDGSLDFDNDVLAELDLVVASLHSGLGIGVDAMTERILRVIENPHVDIIAHPTGRIIERRPGTSYDWDSVFEAAARTGTALEINANPARLDLSDRLAREAARAGCLITVNSDAHVREALWGMEFGVAVARRAWLTSDHVVNCWPLERLESWLRR
jgi:DNA polymerase (family X)